MIKTSETGFYTSRKKAKGNPANTGNGATKGRVTGERVLYPQKVLDFGIMMIPYPGIGRCKLHDDCFTCPDDLADKCHGGDY